MTCPWRFFGLLVYKVCGINAKNMVDNIWKKNILSSSLEITATGVIWIGILDLFHIRIDFVVQDVRIIYIKINEQWLEKKGAVEKEKRKNRWLHLLHWLFFLSILAEFLLFIQPDTFHGVFFLLFILCILGKLWCMISLGKFWTLRKLVLPGVLLFKRGPYKFIKEPYHIISLVQLYIVPLLFGAYITALVFPLVYLFIFQVKLPERGGTFSKAPL